MPVPAHGNSMNILLLDNYDSFTFNLLQLLQEAGAGNVRVMNNDEAVMDAASTVDAVVISPGPGLPQQAGQTLELIRNFGSSKRILGVCLGLQAIAEVYGGKLFHTGEILHGEVAHVQPELPFHTAFAGMEHGFDAGLYHSWAVQKVGLPEVLRVTATDGRGVIMGLCHRNYDVCGVQFHPESIMTPMGARMMRNWLRG